MDTGNSAEKLIASILEEAHKYAAAAEARANEEAAEINRRLDEERERLRAEFEDKARAVREEALARARTNAELAARKDLLARKRALIDETYTEAYRRLCAMEGAERDALIEKLLKRECEGGETVRPAPRDRAAIERLAASMDITVGEDDPDVADGFTVRGKNFFKCCSFGELMEEARAAFMNDTVKKLFD